MQVTVERMPGSTVSLDIYADPDEFAVAVDKTYRKIAKDINIPGFRRGKAPRHIIEGMVGREAVIEEAGRDMMDDLFRRAVEQESLVPVGDPRVGMLQVDPIGFNVLIEVFPTVTLGDYTSVRIEPREVELEDSEIQDVLDQLQRQHSEWVEPETPRSPRDGDQITIDLDVFEGDEPFQQPTRDATFVIGETPLFDSIVEAVKMMQPDSQAQITLAFDDDDETVAPDLRGKELRYDLTLKAVKQPVKPELDDDLAKKVGEQYESFAQMREQIEKDLLRNKAQQARNEVITEAINTIAETAEVDIPTSMVDKEIEDEMTQFRSRLAQQRLSMDEYLASNGQTLEELREEIRPNAQRRIRNSLVLQEIAKTEGLEVTDADIDAEIDRLTAPAENPERLRELYRSDYFRGLLESETFDRKLQARVLEIVTEGRGALTGAGAKALKDAEEEALRPRPTAPVIEVSGTVADEDAETDEETAAEQVAEAADGNDGNDSGAASDDLAETGSVATADADASENETEADAEPETAAATSEPA